MTPADIHKLRNDLGFTQREFAQILSCDEDTVSRWERGTSKPSGLTEGLLGVMSAIPGLDEYALGNLRVHLQWALSKGGIAPALLEIYRLLFAMANEIDFDSPRALKEIPMRIGESRTYLSIFSRTEEFVEQAVLAHEDKRKLK